VNDREKGLIDAASTAATGTTRAESITPTVITAEAGRIKPSATVSVTIA